MYELGPVLQGLFDGAVNGAVPEAITTADSQASSTPLLSSGGASGRVVPERLFRECTIEPDQ
ncbi:MULTISPECIES: hypothetical protein [unclassified Endozoicomonas]|uniref:hypothetical protein n=1 Tax=unclassified Endozoicomonas TaxID=2644528 RepID=UPI002148DD33|nr:MULTISPECIES: hypothetical protein [unclassified Endozoicomonas]